MNSTNNKYTVVTTGAYGYINMLTGSSIELRSGSYLYCWGYISGDGTITALSGSYVYEPFNICDIRGGTATNSMNGNSQKVFPISQYYIQNIEAELVVEYGATETVVGTATVQNMTETPAVKFIASSSALYTLSSGASFSKKYNPATDRVTYNVYGNTTLNSISLNVGISVNSANYVLPIMENVTLCIHSGTTTVNQDTENCLWQKSIHI